MTASRLFATFACATLGLAGCSQAVFHLAHAASSTPGAPASSTTSAPASSTTGAPASSTTSVPAAAGSAAAAAKPQPDLQAVEHNLLRLLGNEAVFSASEMQGAPSPLCAVPEGRVGVPILDLDLDRGTLDCFAFATGSFKTAASTESLREFQDEGWIHASTISGVPVKKTEGVFANVVNSPHGKQLQVIDRGDQVSILLAQLDERAENVDPSFVLQHFDKYIDLSHAEFDVLARDATAAHSVKLADEKQQMLAKASAKLAELAEAKAKADAAALLKVKFPAAISDKDGARAATSLRAYIEHDRGVGIDPKAIKRVAMTSRWYVKKSELGLILRRVAEVTVGFERTDVYAMDPNKKCAMATFLVAEEYDGTGWEPPAPNGAASGWTDIACPAIR